jgi:hypothetical protein
MAAEPAAGLAGMVVIVRATAGPKGRGGNAAAAPLGAAAAGVRVDYS